MVGSILLETNRFDRDNCRSFLFSNPTKVISCYKLDDVKDTFFELEEFVSKGLYAAGFISYEAGFAFEDNLKGLHKDPTFPLLWFGIYRDPVIFRHTEKINILPHKTSPYLIKNLRANISKEAYADNIKRIKSFIRKGDTYQVNYTFKYKFNFYGSLHSFYKDLKEKQGVPYSAIIKTQDFSILSLSPELFFRRNKNRIEVRPMKGTFERGRDIRKDRYNMQMLKDSLKNRSENVMIVDLLRNDLGRISKAGSVRTKKLFEVERYETLLQMISVVKSTLKKDVPLYDLFKAIFPSGSVTGAPKISTMKIINSLEKEPRNVYTGSIGFFAPGGKAVFNVAIRTVLVNHNKNSGEMGIGSGIVYDSDPYKEFEECKLKANFITKEKKAFKLIETMLWQPRRGYFLLNHHLDRLLASTEYFDFKSDRKEIVSALKNLERKFNNGFDYKVRLLLSKNGRIERHCERSEAISKRDCFVPSGLAMTKVKFSNKRTFSSDMFLYHKTTNRDLYNEEHARWRKKGYFDIIFTNEKNQVTEGAISNIVVRKGGIFYTPPVECGLLNGVFRRHLLENGKIPIKEKVLYRGDVERSDEVYMVNSVRGMVKVSL